MEPDFDWFVNNPYVSTNRRNTARNQQPDRKEEYDPQISSVEERQGLESVMDLKEDIPHEEEYRVNEEGRNELEEGNRSRRSISIYKKLWE